MTFKGVTRFWPPGWGGRQTGGILLPTVTCAKSALIRALPIGNTNFPFNIRPQLTNNGYIEIVQSWALKSTMEFILNPFILDSYSQDDRYKYKLTRLPLGLRGKSPACHPETNRFRVPNWYQDLFSLALAAIMLLKARSPTGVPNDQTLSDSIVKTLSFYILKNSTNLPPWTLSLLPLPTGWHSEGRKTERVIKNSLVLLACK